jgi:hypothetical protein
MFISHANKEDDLFGTMKLLDLFQGVICLLVNQLQGASNGEMTLGAAIKSGHKTANAILKELGFNPSRSQAPKAEDESFAIKQFLACCRLQAAIMDRFTE